MKKIFMATACMFIIHLLFAQGKVGINTTTPQTMLHVKDSSVLFSGAADGNPTTGNPPVSGVGTRLLWYADKAAFRAGAIVNFSTNWDKNSIGSYSFATGRDTKASGYISTALGYNTVASGSHSIALGSQSIADGDASISMNSLTTASGYASASMGGITTANGDFSVALGYFTKAKAYASVVMGRYNDTASGTPDSWIVTDPVFIIGNGTANNARSNAITVLKNGKMGINTPSPDAMLHVVRNAPSGGSFFSSAQAIFESDQSSYIQFSNLNNHETGLLSGNTNTSIRSALLFRADSSVVIRTGGNNSRLTISTEGNIGAGTTIPAVRMDIEGGLALDESISIATTSPYTITVGNTSYIRVSSNAAPAVRNIILTDGLTVGQILIMECTALSPNGVTLTDSPAASNMELSSNFIMDQNDTITLLWNGANWIELHRSVN
jgi:hypothetical protein